MEGYGSLCSVRGSCLVVLFQWLFLFVGSWGPAVLFGFPSHPSPPFAQVSEEGGLGWIGLGDWRKVPLLERLGGGCFLLFRFCFCFSVCFCVVVVFFGFAFVLFFVFVGVVWVLFLFCYVWFVLFFVLVFCFFVLVSSVSHENHCFPCKSSVLGLMLIQSLFLILVSGSCFLLLFCLFLVSRCSFVSFMILVLFLAESQS